MKTVLLFTAEVLPGTMIQDAASETIRIAKLLHAPVKFDFNGIALYAHPNDNPDDLVRQYMDAIPNVG